MHRKEKTFFFVLIISILLITCVDIIGKNEDTSIFCMTENTHRFNADLPQIDRLINDKNTNIMNQEIEYTSEQNYLIEIIKSRRTVRRFKSTSVPKKHIIKILDAARYAPTAGNQQPWMFLVIQNRERLDALCIEALNWYIEEFKVWGKPSSSQLAKTKANLKSILKNVLSAPVYIAVLVSKETDYPDYILFDGTLAAGYLMIAARAFGYGTGFFTTFFPEDKMKEFFKIPDQYKLICFTPIGVPLEWPKTPEKKKIEEIVVFESF